MKPPTSEGPPRQEGPPANQTPDPSVDQDAVNLLDVAAALPIAPVIRAARTRRCVLTVMVKCPFCGYAHHHGWAGDGGARVSHCGRGQYRMVDVDGVLGSLGGDDV